MKSHNNYGIDLGTSTVKIFSQSKNRTISEQNMIAIREDLRVLAVGNEAYEMFEKTPENITVNRPVRQGRIADIAEAEFVLRTLVQRLDSRVGRAPVFYFSAPVNMSKLEKQAYYEISHSGYLKNPLIYLVDRAICDAIALGIPLTRTKGSMIVNIGGENTEISVIANGQVIISRDIPIGGHVLNEAIMEAVLSHERLRIGHKTARRLKCVLASLGESSGESRKVTGMDTVSGMPREKNISADLVCYAVEGEMCHLAGEINSFLNRMPPQVFSAVTSDGIYLSGGSARIPNIDRYLRRSIGCEVNRSSYYELCTVRGLEELIQSDSLKKWAYTIRKKK